MAKVELDFVGTGGGLFQEIRDLKDAVVGLGGAHKHVQEEIRREVDSTAAETGKLTSAVEGATEAVAVLGKTAAASGTGGLASGIKEGVGASEQLVKSVGKVRVEAQRTTAAVKGMSQGAQAVRITAAEYQKLEQQAKKAGVPVEDLLQSVSETKTEAMGIDEAFGDLNLEPAAESMESLNAQLRAAKKEASELAAQFGIDSEQAIAAQQRVGQLSNAVDTLSQRFQAFDPGKKFEAFNQLSFSLISGFSAVQGIIGAVAGDNQALQQVLFTFQGLLFAGQGLQTFLGSFEDSLKSIRAVLFGNTAAVEVNTASLENNAVGSATAGAAAGASTTGFAAATASVKAFTVSLLTNPVFLMVAALGALAAAVLLSGDEAEKAQKKFERLREELDLYRRDAEKAADTSKELQLIDLQKEQLDVAADNFAAQAEFARRSADLEIEASIKKEKARREEIAGRRQALEDLWRNGDLKTEEYERQNAEITALEIEANAFFTDRNIQRAQLTLELARIDKEAREQAKQDARERKALQEELLSAEKEFADRLKAARLAAAEDDPFKRVELERQANEAELDELERGFKRKIAAIELQKRIGVKAFQDLSELEKQAREDAIIDEGSIRLPAEQDAHMNALREIEAERYLKALSDLYDEAAKTRLDLMAEGAAKEKKQFEADLEARADALRKAKATEDEIREFQRRETEKFERDAATKAIELDAELQEEIIKGRENNGEIEKVFERKKALEIFAIQIAAAEAKLALMKDEQGQEAALRRQQLANTIADLNKQRDALINTPVDINLLDLLGVKPEDQAAVEAAFQQIGQSVTAIWSQSIQSQQADLAQQVSITDQIIADAQRRKDELQSQIEEAQRDREQGYANNLDALRAARAQEEAEEQKALAKKRAIQAEQAKLARQQAVVDILSQASSLLTAGATLFKVNAFKSTAGIIQSIATIAAMIASFAALRGRIKAATAQAFYKGTKSVRRGPGEPEGVDTVHAMLTEDEAVVPVSKNRKHRKLVSGIIDDDFRHLTVDDLRPLLEGTGIRLESDRVKEAPKLARQQELSDRAAGSSAMRGLEDRVEVLTAEVARFRKQEADRPQTTTLPDGRIMVKSGNDIHIIKPAKR